MDLVHIHVIHHGLQGALEQKTALVISNSYCLFSLTTPHRAVGTTVTRPDKEGKSLHEHSENNKLR